MPAKDTYLGYLEEISQVVNFVEVGASLRPHLGKHLNWHGLGYLQTSVENFLGSDPVPDRAYQSLLVSCHAGFEQFIVDLAEDACRIINNLSLTSGEVESRFPGLIKKFRQFSGLILASPAPKKYWNIDQEKLVLDLASTGASSTCVNVLGRTFIVSVKSINSETIIEFSDLFGVNFSWDSFAKFPGASEVLGSSGVRETSNLAKDLFDDLSSKRNMLAHSQGSLVIGLEFINNAIKFYSCLSEYLTSVFDEALS